jgi:hypothetical protein
MLILLSLAPHDAAGTLDEQNGAVNAGVAAMQQRSAQHGKRARWSGSALSGREEDGLA